VRIGAYTIIHADVDIGPASIIESHCVIGNPTPRAGGAPLVLGQNSHVRSHSIFYQGSTFGEGLITGHQVMVREQIRAGPGLQIGSQANLEDGLKIGDYVRTQSNVFIPQGTRIGNYVWIFPNVVITNDPHPPSDFFLGVDIGEFAAIGANATLLPGISIGANALVAAGSVVTRDVPAGMVVAGNPGKLLRPAAEIEHRDGSGKGVYPWPHFFTRGYPDSVTVGWAEAPPEK
jgi:acetyltransferase-like isoleucine patch superfamily enzyme